MIGLHFKSIRLVYCLEIYEFSMLPILLYLEFYSEMVLKFSSCHLLLLLALKLGFRTPRGWIYDLVFSISMFYNLFKSLFSFVNKILTTIIPKKKIHFLYLIKVTHLSKQNNAWIWVLASAVNSPISLISNYISQQNPGLLSQNLRKSRFLVNQISSLLNECILPYSNLLFLPILFDPIQIFKQYSSIFLHQNHRLHKFHQQVLLLQELF